MIAACLRIMDKRSHRRRVRVLGKRAFVMLFVLALWLPLADNLFGLDPAPRLREHR